MAIQSREHDPKEEEEEYGSHTEAMSEVQAGAEERTKAVKAEILEAFSGVLLTVDTMILELSTLSVVQLASLFREHPLLFKPIISLASIAQRAITRDVGITVRTYAPSLSEEDSLAIAGYVKPFLPLRVPLDALLLLDRYCFIDKEMRAAKGRWEDKVLGALVDQSGRKFCKRRLTSPLDGKAFEIDVVCPPKGLAAEAVDVKRVEAAQDVQKRSEEILGHARKLKAVNPNAKFAAVLYIPKAKWRSGMQERLSDSSIDVLAFAGKDDPSIARAAAKVLAAFEPG